MVTPWPVYCLNASSSRAWIALVPTSLRSIFRWTHLSRDRIGRDMAAVVQHSDADTAFEAVIHTLHWVFLTI